jgi:hypothetical protein
MVTLRSRTDRFGIGSPRIAGFSHPVPLPQDLQLSTREEVMFFDTDIGGVVHNLAYLRMIETCRTRLA